jgi:hypothetical protein
MEEITMKITNRLRNKYTGMSDTNIAAVLEWNKKYDREVAKEIRNKIIVAFLHTMLGCIGTLLASSIVVTIIDFIINA